MAQWVFGRFGSIVGVFECVQYMINVLVKESNAVLELHALQLFQTNQEFRRGRKLKQISTKKTTKNKSMRRSPEPKNQSSHSLYFLRQDQFPIQTQIPFKCVTRFFLGSFSDSDFLAKPWMVSFSCVGLANVAALTLLCRTFLRRALSLGCNLWQFTAAFETDTQEVEIDKDWASFSMILVCISTEITWIYI